MPQLLDHLGRPIDTAAIREPQTARVGHLAREFDEHPARGLTPARLASILRMAEDGDLVPQLELADDMEERDAHLYAELGKRRGAVTGLPWRIEEPEGASAAEKDLAAQVRDWIEMISAHANGVTGGLDLVLATCTDAVLKGFAPQEMVWDYLPDGSARKVLVPRITAQPQRWFTTSGDRRRFLLRAHTMTAQGDESPTMGEELQPLAWLMHVHPARNGYLARMSLARVLFWPYLFKHYAVRDLAEFLEIYGLPLRVGKYPSGASDAEKSALLRAVAGIGHNAAGIIPAGMALEFQAAAAGTEVPFAAMWDRMDAAESKAILGQTLTASEGQRGSHALGQVHNDVRMDIRSDDCRRVESTITQQLIRPLVVLNVPGADPRRLPRLVIDDGQPEDLATYADALPKLVGVGVQIPVDWVSDKLRIPHPADGEAVLQARAAAAPAQPGPGAPPSARRQEDGAPPPAALSAQLSTVPQPDAIDELVAEQAAQWRPVLAPLVGGLLAEIDNAVAAGESLAAFAARLPDLVQQMDSAPLAERLARAAFVAALTGQAGSDITGNGA